MKHSGIIGLKLAVIIVALIFAWRIVTLGLADYYIERALDGDIAAVDNALLWNKKHPEALYLKAKHIAAEDPEAAIALLKQTIIYNPADGRAIAELAILSLDNTDPASTDVLAEQAVKLLPASVAVRIRVADYWFKREQWKKVLENWDKALITRPGLGKKIFPSLLQIAEWPGALAYLIDFTQQPPVWWDQFFVYACKHAISSEVIVALTSMRQASAQKLSATERKALVKRFMQEKMWPEAYLAWANGLTPSQQEYLGSVYNGGFELETSNEGFDWHLPKMKGVSVTRQAQADAMGKKALHLRFKNKEMRFRHLYQPLFLQRGTHEFVMKSKIDFLRGRGGLIWTIRCAGNTPELLGASEKLLGAGDWKTHSFKFVVPDSAQCSGQTLRLESTGKHAFDHKLEGAVWFDQVIIRAIH